MAPSSEVLTAHPGFSSLLRGEAASTCDRLALPESPAHRTRTRFLFVLVGFRFSHQNGTEMNIAETRFSRKHGAGGSGTAGFLAPRPGGIGKRQRCPDRAAGLPRLGVENVGQRPMHLRVRKRGHTRILLRAETPFWRGKAQRLWNSTTSPLGRMAVRAAKISERALRRMYWARLAGGCSEPEG